MSFPILVLGEREEGISNHMKRIGNKRKGMDRISNDNLQEEKERINHQQGDYPC